VLSLKRFDAEADFGLFLSNLQDETQFDLIFRDTASLSVIGSRGIRDTIIREIGQNIYDHAGDSLAFITIGTIQALTDDQATSARYNSSSPLERSFFNNLGKSGYLQIVIADRGVGIFSKLKEAYTNDPEVDAGERVKPTESRVIDYAFEIDTTSKSKSLLGFEEGEDPGRGLYWVRELTRRNRGLLSIRSGASIVTYDFLSRTDRRDSESNQSFSDLRKLGRLGGTQLKMCFPLNPDLIPRRRTLRAPSRLLLPLLLRAQYKVLEVRTYFDPDDRWNQGSLQALIDDLLPRSRDRQLSITILDFDGTVWEKDDLYPLLIRVAREQHEGALIVGINTGHAFQIFDIASDILSEQIQLNPLKLRPIIFLKESGFDIVGLPEADREVMRLYSSDRPDELTAHLSDSALDEFCSRYDHLFFFDRSTRRPTLKLDISELHGRLAESYREKIKEIIFDPTKEVFYEGRFLLPSNSYADGYFRVNTLLGYETITTKIEHVFVDAISRTECPDAVLTVSADVRDLAATLAERLGRLHGRDVDHIHLDDARDSDVNAGILLKQLRGRSITIVTSVIGTGRSLETVLSICHDEGFGIRPVNIMGIVDARDAEGAKQVGKEIKWQHFDHEGRSYELETILNYSLRFYQHRPTSWRLENIRRIDPKSNAPASEAPQSAVKPLWSPVDQFFFGNVLRNSRSLVVGHYARRHRHYVHFIDMIRLAEHIGPEIAATIRKDVDAICDVSSTTPRVTHVLYDGDSRGAKIVADHVAAKFSQSSPISMQKLREATSRVLNSIKGQDVVVYESAVSSGAHLQRLLDAISEFGPGRIFAYIIIQRRESDSARFYQKIDSYGGIDVRIRYFVELEIPPYTVWNCPVCERADELRGLRDYCEDGQLIKFIDEELSHLRPFNIENDTQVDEPSEVETDEFVKKAVLRRKLGAAKTDHVPRRALVDIVKRHPNAPEEALRLLEVIGNEVSFLSSYSELFYPNFRGYLQEASMAILDGPRDEKGRERVAINALRALSPDFFVNDFVPLFKGVSHDPRLTSYLFVELLLLIKNGQGDVAKIAEVLALCQSSLEEDDRFSDLSVEDISRVEHLLNYVLRKLRMQGLVVSPSKQPWESIRFLWEAFVGRPGHVHPRLIQNFPKVVGIYSVENFDQAYASYIGDDNFADWMDRVIPMFDQFADCLRPETKNHLTYFVSKGEGTFSGDYEVLDDSLKTLATLRRQGRLNIEQFKRVFFDNSLVNSAIDRLRRYALQEQTSLIRQVLMDKFADADSAIRRGLVQWKERFANRDIVLEYFDRQCEVFVPVEILEDVIDGCLQNAIDHAFDDSSAPGRVRIAVDQIVGELIIRVCDSGKGITDHDLESRPNGGIRRSRTLLSLYGGSIFPLTVNEELGLEGFVTMVEIRLLSKESVI
jgi:anti-sigma regulatory factor (Ser/Thr protein kinase)/orotate phosphoribosyltransferase